MSMKIIDILRQTIVNDATVEIKVEHNNRLCKLSEAKSDYEFIIHSLPDDIIIIKCDKFPSTKDVFFYGNNNECKKADYIIISETYKAILIFEIKRSKNTSMASDIVYQLKGASCIVDYCESIIKEYFNIDNIFHGYTRKYYIGIFKSSDKRPFNYDVYSKNSNLDNAKPEYAKKLLSCNVKFQKLLEDRTKKRQR